MKTAFSTIAIEKMIGSYFGLLGLSLAVQLLLEVQIAPFLFLLLPIPLYLLFRGKVVVEILNDQLLLKWEKRPFLSSVGDKEICFSEIIRWKYRRSHRGPDVFTVILESGEKMELRPSIFTTKDLETALFKQLGHRIGKYHEQTPREVLVHKIRGSGYVESLNRKIFKNRLALGSMALIGSGILALGLLYPSVAESRMTWILFLVLFCSFFTFQMRSSYLKTEIRETLSIG